VTVVAALAVGANPCTAGGFSTQPIPLPTLAPPAGVINSIEEIFAALQRCWQAPTGHNGMEITVRVSFKRDGTILGRPRITFESNAASQDDRIAYRVAVMAMLQRCAPLPFTEAMGDAVAGRPLTLRFDDRRKIPQAGEKRTWLPPRTL
jgi:hypothetical protein